MYAIIATGGKQYRVAVDDIFPVESLTGEVGSTVDFDQVLLVSGSDKACLDGDVLGSSVVKAEILAHQRDDKIIVFKKKRRKNYRRTQGHRQDITMVQVKAITCPEFEDAGTTVPGDKKMASSSKAKKAKKSSTAGAKTAGAKTAGAKTAGAKTAGAKTAGAKTAGAKTAKIKPSKKAASVEKRS